MGKNGNDYSAVGAESSSLEKDSYFSWLVASSAFMVQFMTMGFINNVGALNIYWIEEFKVSQGQVAWAGSLNYGVVFISGPIVALLSKKIGCQLLGVLSAVICFLGLFATSFSQTYAGALFCYGCIFGFGVSCAFFSSILILPKYFDKRLASANGIVSAGSGAGTMVLSVFLSRLYETLGWRSTLFYGSFCFIGLALLTMLFNDVKIRLMVCYTTNRIPAYKLSPWLYLWNASSELLPISLFKIVPFAFFNIACFVFMLGYLVPYIHLIGFAISKGIDDQVASMLVGYMALSSLIGKLTSSKIAEFSFVNTTFLMTISFIFIGFSAIFATLSKFYWHFVLYSVIFGFFDGLYASLVPFLVGKLVGIDNLGGGVGLLFAVKSIPLTLGSPLAGFLYDYTKSYTIPFVTAGVFVLTSALIMFFILFYQLYHPVKQYTLLVNDHDNQLETVASGEESIRKSWVDSKQTVILGRVSADQGVSSAQPGVAFNYPKEAYSQMREEAHINSEESYIHPGEGTFSQHEDDTFNDEYVIHHEENFETEPRIAPDFCLENHK